MARLRCRTLAMSVLTAPFIVPNSAAWLAKWATLALQISFLLGMQATLGHEPPTHCRSTTAVRCPVCARCQASSLPPCPLPRITVLKSSAWAIASSVFDVCGYSVAACFDAMVDELKENEHQRRAEQVVGAILPQKCE